MDKTSDAVYLWPRPIRFDGLVQDGERRRNVTAIPTSDYWAPRTSPCHHKRIDLSRGDGVMIGSCSTCGAHVCRVNPRTGVPEWLDNNSPWSPDDLRPMKG